MASLDDANQKAQFPAMRDRSHSNKTVPHALSIVLLFVFSFDTWDANEALIRGQVHGIEDTEGAWVGLKSEATKYRNYQAVPFSEAFVERERNERTDWTFVSDGKFELRSNLSKQTELIVVAKNRVPLATTLEPEEPTRTINVHLKSGMTLSGRIQDRYGVPISGAAVSMTPIDMVDGIPSFAIPSWESGDDGSFHAAGLEAGEYLFVVTAEGYAPVVVPEIVIFEAPIAPLEVELAKGFYVSGRAISEDGVPIPDLRVSAGWLRSHFDVHETAGVKKIDNKNQYGHIFAITYTSVDGTFRFGPFEMATNGTISARSPEFGATKSSPVYAPYDNLVLRLRREKLQGRILDESTGNPITEFSVVHGYGVTEERIQSSDGFFEIPVGPVNSDTNVILIDSDGYCPWIGRLYQGSTGIYDLGDVLLEQERIVSGTVRNGGTGAPLEGVRILRNDQQYEDSTTRVFLSNWGQMRRAITNEKGEFQVRKVPRATDQWKLSVPGHGLSSVDIPSDVREFDIDLHFDASLEGSLVLPNGDTVEGVVRLRGSSLFDETAVTTNGVFRLEGLSPGTYLLIGESEAGLVRSRSVTLEIGERVSDLELTVQPGWTAHGRISGLKAAENVTLEVRDPDRRVWIRKSFRNGPYSIHGIPGKVAIVARTSTNRSLIRVFPKGNSEGSEIDFNFEFDSRLKGSVTSGGEPVRELPMTIEPDDLGTVIGYTTTTASGSYVVNGLSDGPYFVKTRSGLSFEVKIDGDTTFDIELPQNSVNGIVRSERTRSAVGGGLVRLTEVSDLEATRPVRITKRIGSDGTFNFEGLIAGDYEISVSHRGAENVSSRMQVKGPETIELLVQCDSTSECTEAASND